MSESRREGSKEIERRKREAGTAEDNEVLGNQSPRQGSGDEN